MSDQESDNTPHPTDSENSSSETEDIISDSDCSISDDDLEEDEVGIDESSSLQKGGTDNKKISISKQSLPVPLTDNAIKLPLLTEDDADLDGDTESEEE